MRKPVQFRRVPDDVKAAVAAAAASGQAASAAQAAPAAAVAAVAAPAQPQPISFATDIRPLFQQFQGPMAWRFDLTDYDAVLGNAENILQRISSAGNPMPPPPFPPLTRDQIATFQEWINQGCPP
jgi:hypothetical protein